MSLEGHRTKWQVPGVPDGESVVIDPRASRAERDAAPHALAQPASQMPPLGTVIQDREAIALLQRWLESAGDTVSREHER